VSLILVAWGSHPDYPLIVCANREEFHSRTVDTARWLSHAPDVLAAYDADADDTWLGVSRSGRCSAVTCYRNPKAFRPGRRSRGKIVGEVLAAETPTLDSLRSIRERGDEYNLFSMLVFDGTSLGWCSNRLRGVGELRHGVYGLSNHLLDTAWHKLKGAKAALIEVLRDSIITPRDLLQLLDDRERAPGHMMPNTGIGRAREGWLSPRFVVGEAYGTRTSTVVLFRSDGHIDYVERSFDRLGVATGTLLYDFEARPAVVDGVVPSLLESGHAALG
jgi:uncharacterized protein with NRDE domain